MHNLYVDNDRVNRLPQRITLRGLPDQPRRGLLVQAPEPLFQLSGPAHCRGVSNKLTQNMKNLIQDELVRLGPNHFHAWALEDPTEFYKIAARLIPAAREISGREGGPIEYQTIREYSTEELYRMIED